MITEADTCRKYVLPRLLEAGWDDEPHSFTEQRTFTDGRVITVGSRARRGPQKRADYLLRYTPDMTIAVVEAKAAHKTPSTGLQQAKEYAEILDLEFAYSTNGHSIVEYDYLTGQEKQLDSFPKPDELWARLKAGQPLDNETAERLLTPSHLLGGTRLRYYQEIAINRAVDAILKGKRRSLLTMATGTGKTIVAFQICWKLWSARWNRTGEHRRPKILYLADRNILVDEPKDKVFTPFGDARWKIENGQVNKGREMYFAIYQVIAKDERRPGLYREYAPDFFDLIIVDECHRGSAKGESNWREILECFEPAFQLGMTATPLRDENQATYRYFGKPVYQYSLKQGIEDGFLAPYRVHRVITSYDAAGWRPSKGERDRYGGTVWRGEIQECIHQNHIYRLRLDPSKYDPDFLSSLISSPYGKAYFRGASKQTTNLATMNQKQLKAFQVPRLSISEQRRLVGYLDDLQAKVDSLKVLQVGTTAELDALLPSVLDRAFNGEL